MKISLRQAADFHGHLGPYLVLGLLMGEYLLKKLKTKPHFGLEIIVDGAAKKPKSCLIDGLQLSTGCTYGKGNIAKDGGKVIKVTAIKSDKKKTIILGLKDEMLGRIAAATTHKSSQRLARELYPLKPECIFDIISEV